MSRSTNRTPTTAPLPDRIAPQLTQLVDTAPDGDGWLHEIKYDGYRMHARLDRGAVKLLTRTGLDWTHKYPGIAGDFLRNQLSAHCNGHPTEIENGGRSKILTAIPARPASTESRNSHTLLTTIIFCRMRPTITSNFENSLDADILKGHRIVVKVLHTTISLRPGFS